MDDPNEHAERVPMNAVTRNSEDVWHRTHYSVSPWETQVLPV